MATRSLDAQQTQDNPDPFGGNPANWTLPEYDSWSDALPDDVEARAAWEDESEAAALRELEECQRVGNDFGHDLP